jgi:3-isopropylmalate/(R)-2-methylmalate dehydratase small subunit
MSELIKITHIIGRPIPLRGNDIDTDRIIPARFMKAVTFDGLGQYSFYDERLDGNGQAKGHVMDDPRFQAKGTRVAVVNKNFGCGSSREHAPQALMRWGIKALVGESFADIFFGNCLALGIPCVTASEEEILYLMLDVEQDPTHELAVDLEEMKVTYGDRVFPVRMPPGARSLLLAGTWDATRILLQARDEVRNTANRLPYVRGFAK